MVDRHPAEASTFQITLTLSQSSKPRRGRYELCVRQTRSLYEQLQTTVTSKQLAWSRLQEGRHADHSVR